MIPIDKNTRDEILRSPYITANGIYQVLPVGKNKAFKIFSELYDELQERGVMLFESRPRTIPTIEFKKKYL